MNISNTYCLAGGWTDITPKFSIPLSGFSDRKNNFSNIAGRLEINGLSLKSDSKTILILQFDTLSVGNIIRNKIETALQKYLTSDEIFIISSHNHFAPGIDPALPDLGLVNSAYITYVTNQAIDLCFKILQSPYQPVELFYSQSLANNSINRRGWHYHLTNHWPFFGKYIAIHPNPKGHRDETLRFIQARNSEQQTLALLWNYACHPVCFPSTDNVHPEYPGIVRAKIRNHLNAQIPIIFLPSFMGDTRPNFIQKFPLSPRKLLRRLIDGPIFYQPSLPTWHNWSDSLAQKILAGLGKTDLQKITGDISTDRSKIFLHQLSNIKNSKKYLTIQTIKFSQNCIFLGLSAEIVAEYEKLLHSLFNPKILFIPIGYLDSVIGYLPTDEMLSTGGAEVVSSGYGLPNNFTYQNNLEQKIVHHIKKII